MTITVAVEGKKLDKRNEFHELLGELSPSVMDARMPLLAADIDGVVLVTRAKDDWPENEKERSGSWFVFELSGIRLRTGQHWTYTLRADSDLEYIKGAVTLTNNE